MAIAFYLRKLLTKKKLIIAAILIVLYTVAGFFIVPPILKSALLSGISEQLGRDARVKEVRFNPFVLSLLIKDFEMDERDGELFAGFGEFYVNFQLSSIFRAALTFNEIRLIAPEGHVKILPDGKLNFSDLLSSSEQSEPVPDQNKGVLPILVYTLEIDKGRFSFEDLSRPTPFETTFFPIRLTLNNFSTRKDNENPYAFTATTGEGERLNWEGRFSVDPFRSKGRIALTGLKKRTLWNYIQHQVHFEVTGGTLDIGAQYDLDAGTDAFQFKLTNGELKIQDFSLTEKGRDQTLVAIPFLSVHGIDMDLNGKQVQIASITSRDARVEGWVDSGGKFHLQTLFAMDGNETGDDGTSPTPPVDQGAENDPWQFIINELKLENYGIGLENRTLAKPPRVELEPIALNLKNLSNRKGTRAEATLMLKVNKTGSMNVKGRTGINPAVADLAVQLEDLDLKLLQPYLDSVAQLDLASGQAGLDGSLKYKILGDNGPVMRFQGSVSMDDLKVVDRLHAEDLVRWDALNINGIGFDFAPNRLTISEIIARKPYARVVIWPDRTVNVSSVFSVQEGKTADEAVYLVERPISAVKSEGEGPMPITIDSFRVENGSVNFADMSLKPNVATGIHALNGTVKGLTSETLGRADVLIEGKVDKYAPMKISGQINPLSEDAYTDLVVSFKNIGLTPAGPYTGKFVGYTIEKGKLSLDLKYKLSKNMLTGENKIRLDQLTFGDRTDSPDATNLPVKLAVAILKDRNGIIDLDLPVRGDLNDPEFSYGGVVLKALKNIITSIAASPFAALGNLVGMDGKELSFLAFEFGSASLEASQGTKLEKLAKALIDRPTLRLEIKGFADGKRDGPALAEKKLLHQLRAAKRQKSQSVSANREDLTLSDDEYAQLLIKAYEDKFGENPEALLTDAQKASDEKTRVPIVISAAKKRLLESMPVDETALRELARERAMNIKEDLVQQGGVQDQQVFIAGVEIAEGADGDIARTNLTLSGI